MDEGDGSEPAVAALFAGSKSSGDCAVFPPSNHENLHLLPSPVLSLSAQSSSSSASNFSRSSPSPSSSASSSYSDVDDEERDDPGPPKPPIRVTVPLCERERERPGWLRIGIGLICSKVLGEPRPIVGSGGSRRVIWSVGAFAAVAVWVWWLFVRIRFRRRWMRMVRGIRERDEKIAQLLHQIAQMNEVLLVKHKDLASRLPN